jgi:hypothetical protein
VPGAEADGGVGASHVLSLVAVQAIVPVPVFVMAVVTAGGEAPTAANISKSLGLAAMTAVLEAVTVNVMLTCAAGPAEGEIVMTPV